jgi:PucR family transcriptional regulator, purine catabolism regulatory protein
MALTVRDIVSIPGMPLKLLAGDEGADRPVRWVHSSELEDPTAWLKGGELILTTGMGVGETVAKQRAYIRRLIDAGVAGLGFGLGFGHEKTPRALVTEAGKHGFPLFEVPYPVPFIAITEAVFTRVVAEQYDTLQRAVDAEHVLTRAVLEGAGVEGVARSLADVVGGWALVLDLHGMPLAATDPDAEARRERIWDEVRTSRPEAATFSLTMLDEGFHVWVQPVGAHGRIEAFLAVGTREQPSQLDRIVAGHALSLFAIELAKSRAVAEAERRLQGDFFDELARGELPPADAARGLIRFGFTRDAGVFVVAVEPVDGGIDSARLALAATDHCSRREGGFLISAGAEGISILLPASAALELPEFVKGIGQRVDVELRAGAGSGVDAASVGRSLREARYALQICRLEGWQHAGFEQLGTYRLLLSMTEPDALRAFADALLAPLDAYDADRGGDLLASLQAFLQHNARWETAASQLYVHRHTLRYRMRKVEELTGRDLTNSFDRMEFWLALRARDLFAASQEP